MPRDTDGAVAPMRHGDKLSTEGGHTQNGARASLAFSAKELRPQGRKQRLQRQTPRATPLNTAGHTEGVTGVDCPARTMQKFLHACAGIHSHENKEEDRDNPTPADCTRPSSQHVPPACNHRTPHADMQGCIITPWES